MAEKDDKLKDIEKLSPQERIRRLREIEEKDKEEIEKAQELIKDSEDEIEIEEKLKHVEVPETEEVDVGRLFTPEENLEGTVERERVEISEGDIRQQQEYMKQLPTQQIEQRAEYIQQKIQETGYVSNEQRAQIAGMYQEIRQREDGLRTGAYKPTSKRVEEELNMAKSIAKKVLGDLYNR